MSRSHRIRSLFVLAALLSCAVWPWAQSVEKRVAVAVKKVEEAAVRDPLSQPGRPLNGQVPAWYWTPSSDLHPLGGLFGARFRERMVPAPDV